MRRLARFLFLHYTFPRMKGRLRSTDVKAGRWEASKQPRRRVSACLAQHFESRIPARVAAGREQPMKITKRDVKLFILPPILGGMAGGVLMSVALRLLC